MREHLMQLDIFDVLGVISYEAEHGLNQHGKAVVRAMIEESREDEYVEAARNTRWVNVWALDEAGKDTVLFCGVLERVCFFKDRGSFLVELVLSTGSSLMEKDVHTRGFSEQSRDYTDILDACKKGYDEAYYIIGEEGKGSLPDFLIQYRENDWNFVKRIAALKETVIIPDYQTRGVKYFFGMPKRDRKVLSSSDIRMIVNKEYTEYEVRTREIFHLGDSVSFNRKDYYICN